MRNGEDGDGGAVRVDAAPARDGGERRDGGEVRDARPMDECARDEECTPMGGACGRARCDAGRCVVEVLPAGTVCRAAAGVCDVAESCDGANADCPAERFAEAGTVCRAAAGVCDVAESCDGASRDCPAERFAEAGTVCRGPAGACDVPETCNGDAACAADSGPAAACTPTTPIFYSALGRNARFDLVDLNGTGRTVATVTRGATVSVRVAGSWVSTGADCPGCLTQFYARMNGVFSLCFGNTTGNTTFDRSTTFTAPATPGVYVINPAETWDYNCVANTVARTGFDGSSLATLVVE